MFNYCKTLLLFSFVVFTLSSCSSRRNILFNTVNEKSIPDLPVYTVQEGSTESNTKEQIIQPGDLLSIRNLQNEALISGLGGQNLQTMSHTNSIGYRVEADGTVLLPVIGKVKLGGMDRLQAQEELNRLYQTQLLNAPIITLQISNLTVTFLGEFGRQGNFILQKDQVHLVQMLGEAGGLNTRANKRKVKIIRGDLKHPEVLIANLEDINSLSDPRLMLRNNDVVYAEPRGAFQTLDRLGPTTSLLGIGLSILNIYLLISNLSK
ncbi:polysaccharide export protein [Pseudopedobacter saltans DSM 12145]|uniref:Polysaccharide export protein n=1 Tax=Pseudopedobacter saltans (strain ATCC 51119 / DSM 12145 / JCM 21818 / CCUG 39354 / LMG 10337 / NBRC 100064 / NCIMB 13643) TaxID=762903 RepID=F0SD68_PSESL|nr:polysaccharide biosynthesis/export family protein [Pseudopedobacter saltans]ADY52854.1 polysaccharide export protein [Pseudopedobacter saltans DSM 12145]